MNTGIYVLLAIVIVLLIALIVGFTIYLIKKHKKAQQNDLLTKMEPNQISNDVLKEKIEQTAKIIDDLSKKSDGSDKKFLEDLTELRTNLNFLKGTVDKDNKEVKEDLTKKDEKFNSSYQQLMERLTKIINDTKNIEDVRMKLNSLNNVFLNNNKSRGNLGEYVLEKMLSDLYGETNNFWAPQYKMNDNNIVDAIIKTSNDQEDIVIDSKFPLTNYNNYINAEDKQIQEAYKKSFKTDVKNKVDEVAKYINPTNKVTNAIMFIPSEEIFAFIYAQFPDEIVSYAYKKKVWITSPTTLAAILFILDRQNSEMKLNKNLEEIKSNLLKLRTEFIRWSERWAKVTKSLGTVNENVNQLDITQNKIQKRYQDIYASNELGEE